MPAKKKTEADKEVKPKKKAEVKKAEPKKADASLSVGKKMKAARAAKDMALERLANETGFAVEYLNDVEEGKITPPVGALLQIAKALQMDSGSLLKEQESSFALLQIAKALQMDSGSLLKEQESSFKDRVTAYTKRTDNYAYETLTPGAENKHLKAFRITIDPKQEHKGVGYQHEGEEFDYVLKGKVQVIVGDHVNTLEAGGYLHFNSAIKHQLKNVGKDAAELIVVIYSP